MKTLCSVPAKLILSGEHSVLYQCPALSMAIDLPTHCECQYKPSADSSVTVELVNFQQKHCFPYDLWQNIAIKIESRYRLFEQRSGAIQAVLTKPIDLILNTLFHFEELCPLKPGDWQFKIYSEARIGRGMGSSAAVILSVLASLIKHHNFRISDEGLLELARHIECRQHGKSSGIDPATLICGGLLQYQSNRPIQRIDSQTLNAWLIDTGKPLNATGQCVEHVKSHWADDKRCWKQFKNVTQNLVQAWSKEDALGFKNGIRENQQLLYQLGVVPVKVQVFIDRLEKQYDASAKICGAGSVSGDSAGMVLCISEKPPLALCETYGYECLPLNLQTQGIECNVIESEQSL
jgi:mevalonate kinase